MYIKDNYDDPAGLERTAGIGRIAHVNAIESIALMDLEDRHELFVCIRCKLFVHGLRCKILVHGLR